MERHYIIVGSYYTVWRALYTHTQSLFNPATDKNYFGVQLKGVQNILNGDLYKKGEVKTYDTFCVYEALLNYMGKYTQRIFPTHF